MSPRKLRRSQSPCRGFTLIELLVVLAIVALLLTLSLPRYFQSIDKSKETILRENLRITRETIDKYFDDRGRYPDSLQELVDRHYLRALPMDPITQSNTTWVIVPPEDPGKGGVFSIKSPAIGQAQDGTPYADF
ncbi:type II secretion system protein G [Cupriavidus sp. USMAA2-4]|uniref:type II secretion system protein n=1 Tax=Cupriavidus sp. USMAA2-4 TaxID=876364 RepID=UPI0008A69201|nr:prepilin-type N-terminal cleavage/methylation domain-containing protein [Cupriavidus sp. USMAA2-4]AOY90753.1 type II secretion system protein G [Cupriavidus sp. USMAA2-4]